MAEGLGQRWANVLTAGLDGVFWWPTSSDKKKYIVGYIENEFNVF